MLLLKIYYKKYMKYMLSGIPRKSISTYKTTIITTNLYYQEVGEFEKVLTCWRGRRFFYNAGIIIYIYIDIN